MTQRPEICHASTPLLDIAYEASGPDTNRSVILLHGWPDDVRTWDRLLPSLHEAGFRTLVPYLRGFGPTRFKDASTMRSGQLSALGRDVWEFADAIGLQQFSLVGHDWGARAAYITACLMPERVNAVAALSVGWGTNSPDQPLSLNQAQNYWYHWLMALPRGERVVRDDRRNLVRHIWSIWNPGWSCPDGELEETLAALSNPDWADITLHSYRVRWGHAAPDPSCDDLEARLRSDPAIRVSSLVLHGGKDPCNAPSTSEGKDGMFASAYERHVLRDLGHFPQRQDAAQVADRLVPFLVSNA